MFAEYYHYTLNGIEHRVARNRVEISSKLLTEIPNREKEFLTRKYLLKYIHDFFEFHSIDYAIYHQTLLGHQLFEGIHLFHPHLEIITLYRDFEEFRQELTSDGFHIEFISKYLLILSTSFFHKISVRLFIYFLHPNHSEEYPSDYYHLSPSFVLSCKSMKGLLQEKCDYHMNFVNLSQIFPTTLASYEDFQIFLPRQPVEILSLLQLHQSEYHFLPKKEKSKIKEEEEEPSQIQSFFSSISNIIFPSNLSNSNE